MAEVSLVQLVFTHNCEHGWIYGYPCSVQQNGAVTQSEDDEEVQIGPEQLIAILGMATTTFDDATTTRILDEASRRKLFEDDSTIGSFCS